MARASWEGNTWPFTNGKEAASACERPRETSPGDATGRWGACPGVRSPGHRRDPRWCWAAQEGRAGGGKRTTASQEEGGGAGNGVEGSPGCPALGQPVAGTLLTANSLSTRQAASWVPGLQT